MAVRLARVEDISLEIGARKGGDQGGRGAGGERGTRWFGDQEGREGPGGRGPGGERGTRGTDWTRMGERDQGVGDQEGREGLEGMTGPEGV